MSSHSQPDNAAPADCCIEGHAFTPHCNPTCRKECFRTGGDDLMRNLYLTDRLITELAQTKPHTSSLFRRVQHILHCLLGVVTGYGLLLQLWQVVLQLREAAQQDAQINAAHIIVRLPGSAPTKAEALYFDLTDELPHGQ